MQSVATIGFFDGVHEGHRYVVSQVIQLAKRRNSRSVVVTFRNHPASLFCPEKRPLLLTTAEEKREKLLLLGVDEVVMMDFSHSLASLSAKDFMLLLKNDYSVDTLLLGYDNRFGHREQGKNETFEDYVQQGDSIDVEVLRLKSFYVESLEHRVRSNISSSTLIRNLLQEGALDAANSRLGYRYSLEGEVISGFQIGRTIGFPTANINVKEKLVPQAGVYAVTAFVGEEKYKAVLNIGTRPTFQGHQTTVEVHIIGFSGDLYGKQLRIEFVKRLREERKFDSKEALIDQIVRDKEEALKV